MTVWMSKVFPDMVVISLFGVEMIFFYSLLNNIARSPEKSNVFIREKIRSTGVSVLSGRDASGFTESSVKDFDIVKSAGACDLFDGHCCIFQKIFGSFDAFCGHAGMRRHIEMQTEFFEKAVAAQS